jgi:tetratricopeptide (TPR) repeat protein
MKKLLGIILFFASLTASAQSLSLGISLYEKKDYINAFTQLSVFVAQDTLKNADFYKAKYYLAKTIFDQLQGKNEPIGFNYHAAMGQWKYNFIHDKSNIWLHKMEQDIIAAIQLAAITKEGKSDFNKEIINYTEMLKAQADNPVLLLGLGMSYDRSDDHENAFANYSKVIQLYESKKNEYYRKTAATANLKIAEDKYFRSNNYIESLKYAQTGLKYDASNIELQTIEALSLYKGVDEKGGKKKFDALVKAHPNNGYVKEKYAYLLEGTDKGKAVELYETLIKEVPNNTRALFFIGSFYTNKATDLFNSGGNPQEVQTLMLKGIDSLEKYHNIRPQDKEIIRSLIKFYENLRMNEKAELLKNELAD